MDHYKPAILTLFNVPPGRWVVIIRTARTVAAILVQYDFGPASGAGLQPSLTPSSFPTKSFRHLTAPQCHYGGRRITGRYPNDANCDYYHLDLRCRYHKEDSLSV